MSRTETGLADVLPLTPLQEGMLFHSLYADGATDVYTVQLVVHLDGPVDEDRMRAAVAGLLDRHTNLRAAFRHKSRSHPLQLIPRRAELPWRTYDLSALDPGTAGAELERLLAADRELPFDLARPPLVRATLVRLTDSEHRLVLSLHHILFDGWSTPVLLRELLALYASDGDPRGLPPVTPYREYLGWLAAQDQDATRAAWSAALDGLTEGTRLAPADPGSGRPPALPLRYEFALDADTSARLLDHARALGLTPNTVVQGAWGLLLGALTARDDIVFGATVSGRPAELPGVEGMVGLFINTLPVRITLRPGESVADLLQRIQREQTDLLPHQHASLAAIQAAAGAGELFDSMLAFESYPVDGDALRAGADGPAITEVTGRDATHYPLTLVSAPGPELRFRLDYRADCFSDAEAVTIARRLLIVLERFADDPDRGAAALSPLTAAERHTALRTWNDTARAVPYGSLPELFAAQVRRTPHATALVAGGTRWDYAELDARSERLARRLRTLGVAAETPVAVLMERSADQILALLAIVKAGGAYVPLHLAHPAGRMELMLKDIGAPVLLVDERTRGHELIGGGAGHSARTLVVSEAAAGPVKPVKPVKPVRPAALGQPVKPTASGQPGGTLAGTDGGPAAEPLDRVHPDQLAYVMYTSGSTGTPKGVAVSHLSVVALALDGAFHGNPAERVLIHSPASFDPSSYEIWSPLLTGGRLVVAPHGDLDAPGIAELIRTEGVTTALITAGLFRVIAEDSPDCFRGMREVLTGGDVVSPAAVQGVLDACPGTSVRSLYGPTEITLCATHFPMRAPDPAPVPVPIGRPMDNTGIHILNAALEPVPAGVQGELYITGTGLARGYLGHPGRSAERFVADPHGAPGDRMYRTGDVARRREDGVLEFLGRADDQVKIRGFRIEPGEIEAVLAAHRSVGQAAVVVREDGRGERRGDRRLAAYVVPAPGVLVDPADLRAHLAERLPEYMVPTAFVVLDALPVTENGKLDRQALPRPDRGAHNGTGSGTRSGPRPGSRPGARASGDDREEILRGLFEEVLDVENVGADDNFFDLGGHSLLAMRLIGRIRTWLGIEAGIRSVFQTPTPATLAAALGATGGSGAVGGSGARPDLR
ncbi:MAG: hypothetical protein QOF98_2457, partial [Streptomyces sp.]|nr:hypothetical protein [Streptomyces sp.]